MGFLIQFPGHGTKEILFFKQINFAVDTLMWFFEDVCGGMKTEFMYEVQNCFQIHLLNRNKKLFV